MPKGRSTLPSMPDMSGNSRCLWGARTSFISLRRLSTLIILVMFLSFPISGTVFAAGESGEQATPETVQPEAPKPEATAKPEETKPEVVKPEATPPKPLRSPVHPTKSTADHSKFDALKGPFNSGPEVTKACLTCHNKAGHQFQKSIHWTLEYKNQKTGQILGKHVLVNNFCTNARGNEGMCAQCHASYNWTDANFDFTKQENIDCVVCHEQTGTYYKTPTTKGNSACSIMFEGLQPIDWTKVAQSVGRPERSNCGTCHFNGGGGDGVKHGDLDSSLINPPRELDVHMHTGGENFACTKCHISNQHMITGSRYDVQAKDTGGIGKPGSRRDVATCESCHGDAPHPKTKLIGLKLNGHVSKVACQTCHIPALSRGGVATITDWDWREAGNTKNGVGFQEEDYVQGNGERRHTYRSIKGRFTYGETAPEKGRTLLPYYAWFDGQMNYTTIDTKFDPAKQPIPINSFTGSYNDPKSRIWPFKRMHTWQPYDKGNNTLVYMHLWGEDKDAYWGNYNFDRAIQVGMKENGKPYSGQYGFIETYSFWPTTHMVAPKEQALKCSECHSTNGRLANLGGFYMPGRDSFKWVDLFGLLIIAGALAGVVLHVIMRCLARCFRKGPAHD
jgi:octaheme c-type cytochrome (tetrathionate reductase family)